MENSDWFYDGGKDFLVTCLKEDETTGFAVIARVKGGTKKGSLAGCFLVEIPRRCRVQSWKGSRISKEQLLVSAIWTAAV